MGRSIVNIRKRRGPGRPKVNATPIGLRLPPPLLTALDSFIDTEDDAPSRPEAVRRLLGDALVQRGLMAGENGDGSD